MASLVKAPTSKYWIAAFRDSSGKQHRRTTRESDRKRAQVVADQYERVAQGKGNAQRVRQILSEFFRHHYGEDLPFISVRKYALDWLATRKAETAVGTCQRYHGAVQKFLAFLGTDADKSLEDISRAQIAAFRDARIARARRARQTTICASSNQSSRVRAVMAACSMIRQRVSSPRRTATCSSAVPSPWTSCAPCWRSLTASGSH